MLFQRASFWKLHNFLQCTKAGKTKMPSRLGYLVCMRRRLGGHVVNVSLECNEENIKQTHGSKRFGDCKILPCTQRFHHYSFMDFITFQNWISHTIDESSRTCLNNMHYYSKVTYLKILKKTIFRVKTYRFCFLFKANQFCQEPYEETIAGKLGFT